MMGKASFTVASHLIPRQLNNSHLSVHIFYLMQSLNENNTKSLSQTFEFHYPMDIIK